MNDIANGIKEAVANFASLIDLVSAIAGGFVDVGVAMTAVLRVIAALIGA